MNLATRCLSCGTVFRVGAEQLLASEGWVRCGRCNGVFNAAEVLFDIDTGAPMQLALPGPADAGVPPQADAPAASAADDERAGRFPDEPLLRAPSREDEAAHEPIHITDHVPPPRPPVPPPAPPAPAGDGGPPPASPPGADRAPGAALVAMAGTAPAAAGAPGAVAAPAQATAAEAAPSFLRQAERGARWRHPVAQLGLWALVLVLALTLVLQAALLWRDSLAAHLPKTQPALQALCSLAGCSVLPLRRIGQLAVASSGLNRLEGAPLYRLQLVLHNRAGIPVMAPALDLALTDAQGQLVARRVLAFADLGLERQALQPGEQLPIKVLLSTGERRVDGYTLELFYP